MSAVERALCLLAFALAGCSSPGPGAVHTEARAIDLEACLRNDPSCRKTGPVSRSEALFEGDHAVMLLPPGSISLPLERAAGGSRLRWLALGMLALPLNDAEGKPGKMKLVVTVDGTKAVIVQPRELGWKRFEVDMRGITPAPDARVTLTAIEGRFDLIYTSGRWDE